VPSIRLYFARATVMPPHVNNHHEVGIPHPVGRQQQGGGMPPVDTATGNNGSF
jgi:hypothetical protein